ncbi:bZIP transcription factor TGA10-like [Impatiens glandulifera]|uniref:bZIP transcription factor TGA10-like n=1 Tax=Impatiens glandulifera TaxID=253017 RepID=UPI001FB157F6|nr:bZIP transcription factor TGA10-like [Impatiens glandulifera]
MDRSRDQQGISYDDDEDEDDDDQLGDLDNHPSLFLNYIEDDHDHGHQKQTTNSEMMRPPTLNIFPSQPMHVDHSSTVKTNDGLVSPATTALKHKTDASSEPPKQRGAGNHKGPTRRSERETLEPKVLRRLAQNREAARKSRLRKKAYVHQLESSRIRLNQLEQELQRARNQGFFVGGEQLQGISVVNNISPDGAIFDMEYGRWLDEQQRMANEVRTAVQENLGENELRVMLDNCLARFQEMLNLKAMVIKSDVFHIFSGMWKTPAERCFMWIGGFRPSDILKVILNNVEPLSEQQILVICELQQSTQQAEAGLSHGLDMMNRSVSDAIGFDYPQNMAMAINKLSTLEGFIRQAESLRHDTVHRLYQYLTTQQAARYFLAITEYFHRLRALSSLWMGRPRQDN